MTAPTRDEIIAMAREAAAQHGHTLKDVPEQATIEFITAFFTLAFAAGAAAEREAMVAEASKKGWGMRNDDPFEDCVREIAAIRARGQA